MSRMGRAFGFVVLLALPALGDDWGHLGRDDARQRVPGETILAPASLGAGVAVGGQVAGSPVAADGFLVVADLDGNVRAFKESDRTLVWTAATGGSILATPLVAQGRVVVPTGDGELRMFRLADGAPIWTAATSGADQSSPILSGGTIFLGSGFPAMGARAVNAADGSVVWTATFDQMSSQSPALSGGRVYLGSNAGTLYALDAADGSTVWTFPAGGTGGPSSPLIDGASIYLVTDGSFQRIDTDDLNWASSNWSVAIADPAPPAGALGVEWAASSPAKAGALIVFLARFIYPKDDSGDGYPDTRVLREFAVAVDPSSKAIAWQVLLGSPSVPDVNGLPQGRLCPSPVATGPASVAVASSVDASLRVLALANGAVQSTFALDAPCLASPIVANARLYAVSRAGTIQAFEDPAHVQPAAAAGLSPATVELDATPATLSWTASAAGSTYVVRIAKDGEFLMDWDFEFTVGTSSISCPALDEAGATYAWGVRVLDSANAWSGWSAATFGINIPPAPPSNFTATGKHGKVILNWTASPTGNTVGYVLAYGPTGNPAGPGVQFGNVTTTTVTGLANGTSYTFVLQALDSDNDLSTSVTASATPTALISVGGISYNSLHLAAAAAGTGDTILLGEDTFELAGSLVLQAGVSLQGVNAHVTRIEALGRFVMVQAQGSNSVLLVTLAMGASGVEASGANVLVRNCILRDMSQYGVTVQGGAQVIGNTIVNNAVAGVHASPGSAVARNNIVQGNGVGLTGSVQSTYNDVSDGYQGTSAGTGDLAVPIVFVDPASGDYREAPAQPSVDTGRPHDDFSKEPAPNGGRINLGAFGNTSLAAASAASPPGPSGNLAGCGLTGLELLLLLALRRRRR